MWGLGAQKHSSESKGSKDTRGTHDSVEEWGGLSSAPSAEDVNDESAEGSRPRAGLSRSRREKNRSRKSVDEDTPPEKKDESNFALLTS